MEYSRLISTQIYTRQSINTQQRYEAAKKAQQFKDKYLPEDLQIKSSQRFAEEQMSLQEKFDQKYSQLENEVLSQQVRGPKPQQQLDIPSNVVIHSILDPRFISVQNQLQGAKKINIDYKHGFKVHFQGWPYLHRDKINSVSSIRRVRPQVADECLVLYGKRRKIAGWGIYNPFSLKRMTMFQGQFEMLQNPELILNVKELIRIRIRKALEIRQILDLPNKGTNIFRLLNGEGDRLPALFVDQMNNNLIVRPQSIWCVKYKEDIMQVLRDEVAGIKDIIWSPRVKMLYNNGIVIPENPNVKPYVRPDTYHHYMELPPTIDPPPMELFEEQAIDQEYEEKGHSELEDEQLKRQETPLTREELLQQRYMKVGLKSKNRKIKSMDNDLSQDEAKVEDIFNIKPAIPYRKFTEMERENIIQKERQSWAQNKLINVIENGICYLTHTGQYDNFQIHQRENRELIQKISKDKTVLDLNCRQGGFTIAAAMGGAKSIISGCKEMGELQLAIKSAKLNNVQNKIEFHYESVHKLAEKMKEEQRKFDLIIFDPFQLDRNIEDTELAVKKYRNVNYFMMGLCKSSCLYFAVSCSLDVSQSGHFVKSLFTAVRARQMDATVLKVTTTQPDYPVYPAFPNAQNTQNVLLKISGVALSEEDQSKIDFLKDEEDDHDQEQEVEDFDVDDIDSEETYEQARYESS